MNAHAKFTRMQDGTLEDWQIIAAEHKVHFASTAERYLDMLRQLSGVSLGFKCDQLQHALLCATLARRDGATDEQIVTALCHDIAKVVNVPNHGAIAAEMLKPYVSSDCYYVLKHHQAFQGEYYYQYLGHPTDLRLQWKGEPWYGLACKLVDEWDAPAFDPDFQADSLESFEPEMRRVLHDNPMAI